MGTSLGLLKKIRCLLSQNAFGKKAAPTDFIIRSYCGRNSIPTKSSSIMQFGAPKCLAKSRPWKS